MLDSNDCGAGDSASPSRPARGLVRPRGPAGPNQRGSTDSYDPHGHSQHAAGGSQEGDDGGGTHPEAADVARWLDLLGKACLLGDIDPAYARASATMFKDAHQIRVQDKKTERAAAAAQHPASSGVGANGSGESAGQPRPGAPRMVPASVVDAMLEVAMEHQPQLLRDLEPVLDEEQLARVDEFVRQSLGPGAADGNRS